MRPTPASRVALYLLSTDLIVMVMECVTWLMDIIDDDVCFAVVPSGNGGFVTQFHGSQYPSMLTHQQTWSQYPPHSAAKASVWSPGSGRFEGTHRQPQTRLGHPASSGPVLRPGGSNFRTVSAAKPPCAWNAGSGQPGGSHHHSGHGPQPQPGHGGPRSTETLTLPLPSKSMVASVCCPVCQYTVPAGTQLSDHVRTVHKKSMCVACNKVFNSFASLCYHRNVKHGHSNHLKCGVCGKFFGHKQHMRTHMINVHNFT